MAEGKGEKIHKFLGLTFTQADGFTCFANFVCCKVLWGLGVFGLPGRKGHINHA